MTPREIVLRAIERRSPPRLPVYYCNRDLDEADTLQVGMAAAADFAPADPRVSEWGYRWETLDETMGQPHDAPLADPAALATYRPPDPCAPGRLDHLPGQLAGEERFVIFHVGISGFNQATFLRGFTPFLEDLYLAPERAARTLDLVFDFENGLIDRLAGLPIDAVKFADDWGTQQALMIDPALWRQVFKPRYAAQFARVHAMGMKTWFHTCGYVREILDDLIDIGLDVIELLQPDLFGVERLGREFGGRVCFCCSVDHQRRAVSGTRAEVFDYVARLKRALGSYNGGLIGYVEDYRSLGMSEQNYQWIRAAFRGEGGRLEGRERVERPDRHDTPPSKSYNMGVENR